MACIGEKWLFGEGPRIYGKICGVTTEDKIILDGSQSLTNRIQNCKHFFHVRSTSPFHSEAFGKEFACDFVDDYYPKLKDSLPPAEVETFYCDYREEDAPPTPELAVDGNGILELDGSEEIKRTFRLQDRRNHRIAILFLPLFEEAVISGNVPTGDNIFFPYSVSDGNSEKVGSEGFFQAIENVVAILQINETDFNESYAQPITRIFKYSTKRGEATKGFISFTFEIKREACDNDSVPIGLDEGYPGVDSDFPPTPKVDKDEEYCSTDCSTESD